MILPFGHVGQLSMSGINFPYLFSFSPHPLISSPPHLPFSLSPFLRMPRPIITAMSGNDRLRRLPSVDKLLTEANGLVEQEGRERVINALRQSLDAARDVIRAGGELPTSQEIIDAAIRSLHASRITHPTPLINATGVIIHTNLGRAPLSVAAQEAMLAVARDYTPLEFDMQTGERGRRGEAIEKLLCDLTGAEAALVVNNCAAATVLMLAATSAGKGVIVSRGQLVEIGGGFRVPEIMAQSGAKLIEVGTTNRTKPADYKREIEKSPESIGALLRVHSSNFKMIGFTEEVDVAELVQIAKSIPNLQSTIPILDDLGSGALIDTAQFGLSREPMPQDSVKAGASIIAFSGDKLLGGPQAGLMIGKREWIERCRRHPLARAFRADKFTLAAMGATLMHYARGEAQREVPVIRMMALRKEEIAARAERVRLEIGDWLLANQMCAELIEGESTVGGGSLPGETLPTTLFALTSVGTTGQSPLFLQTALRNAGVIARIKDDRVLLDLRTVLDDAALIERLNQT
jgi:L-seryl-tRNA(Ser) seleniumtransferase